MSPEAGHTPEHEEKADSQLAETAHAGAHGHDAHGSEHAAVGEIIPENSPQDMLLTGLSLFVTVALCGLMIYWGSIKLAPVVENEPAGVHESTVRPSD